MRQRGAAGKRQRIRRYSRVKGQPLIPGSRFRVMLVPQLCIPSDIRSIAQATRGVNREREASSRGEARRMPARAD